jgi:hypothetical protein
MKRAALYGVGTETQHYVKRLSGSSIDTFYRLSSDLLNGNQISGPFSPHNNATWYGFALTPPNCRDGSDISDRQLSSAKQFGWFRTLRAVLIYFDTDRVLRSPLC